jgi:quinolinate synthase
MLQSALGIEESITRLKKEKKAVILAHNYQIPEVQEIADFVGDSLALSQTAAATANIIFCPLYKKHRHCCPESEFLIPDLEYCSLASSITSELNSWIMNIQMQ